MENPKEYDFLVQNLEKEQAQLNEFDVSLNNVRKIEDDYSEILNLLATCMAGEEADKFINTQKLSLSDSCSDLRNAINKDREEQEYKVNGLKEKIINFNDSGKEEYDEG